MLVKMVKEDFLQDCFSRDSAIKDGDQAQLEIQQRQLWIYNQQAE